MKEYKVGVLGASGVVGREMIKILEEYGIPVSELRLLASARSAGISIPFRGEEVKVIETAENSFDGLDFVLGAVSSGLSRIYVPAIKQSGAIYIDNSSAFRLLDDVPLVVPEINGADAFGHHGIIANPNCSSIITLMAVAGIKKLSPIKNMVACTYQAVSGAGRDGLDELEKQTEDYVMGRELEKKKFPAQILMNVIPFIGSEVFMGYTDEEMKMQNEGRKILHLPDMNVTCTCVRVPVLRSHSISVTLRTERAVSPEEAAEAIRNFPGCRLAEDIDGRNYPTPLDTTDQDAVWVGRIRKDLTDPNGLTLWCCGDQIRKGAASNAVGIMKLFTD